jgi:hypothetical protein
VRTREVEFDGLPPGNTLLEVGLPFISSASMEKANHSTRVPLFAKQHLFTCTGPEGTSRHGLLVTGQPPLRLRGGLNCSSTSTW